MSNKTRCVLYSGSWNVVSRYLGKNSKFVNDINDAKIFYSKKEAKEAQKSWLNYFTVIDIKITKSRNNIK